MANYSYTARDNYPSALDYGNGDKVKYTYDDQGRVTKQTYEDGSTVEYRYDNDGGLATVTDSAPTRTFYYVTNIQGDVIAILDDAGTAVVEYTYDAWGNPISSTDTSATSPHALATLNPLRYRSYLYDSEYSFYYLQSRYYNPKAGRFLNSDILASTGQGLLGNNMFAYCNGNPVIRRDATGQSHVLTKVGVISACGGMYIPSSYVYGGIGVAVGALIANAWNEIKQTVNKSLAQAKTATQYRSETEIHHIAAKKSYKVAEARAILEEIFPDGVENPLNKIELKTSVHRRVHTNLYYAAVNSMVVYAYDSAGEDKAQAKENVIATLGKISATLQGLNALAS